MSVDTPEPGALAPLIADLYAEVPPPLRVRLLRGLLRPVGPLALAAIAAGAVARLLPSTRWTGATVDAEQAAAFGPEQVLELARYVEQKSPEWLLQLPDLLGDRPLWAGTLSGSLLLLTVHAWSRRRRLTRP